MSRFIPSSQKNSNPGSTTTQSSILNSYMEKIKTKKNNSNDNITKPSRNHYQQRQHYPTITTSSKQQQRQDNPTNKSTLPKSISPKVALRLELLPKIAEYRSRHWISAAEEASLLNLLSSTEYEHAEDRFEADKAAVTVKKRLEEVKARAFESSRSDNNHNPKSDLTNSRDGTTAPSRRRHHRVTSGERINSSSQWRSNNNNNNTNRSATLSSSSSFASSSTHSSSSPQQQPSLEKTQIQSLFVEMCFFARLGFVQPPCCLRCAHRCGVMSSTLSSANSQKCKELVVWRRNARLLLRPDTLRDNVVIMSCEDARRLLKGEILEGGWRWNGSARVLEQ